MKTCPKCRVEKPFADFHVDRTKANGMASHCKQCRRERSQSIGYSQQRKYDRAHKDRQKAWNILNRAVIKGTMVRPATCSTPGCERPPQGHHDDYSKPLAVEWLCVDCHKQLHKRERMA